MTDLRARSNIVSLTVHAALIALLLTISNEVSKPSSQPQLVVTPLTAPVLKIQTTRATGGGGGEHATLPATAGHPPKIALKQFVPPTVQVNPNPKLVIEPTIEGPPDLRVDNSLQNIGDPLSGFNNGNGGIGGPFGVGNGTGKGIGDKSGNSVGDGDGSTGKVYTAGKGVTAPVLIHSVDPEFSDEARRAKLSGIVLIHAEIDPTGHARNLRLARSLGLGLDEKAMEAVRQWLFRPGTKDGKAVTVSALITVQFQLL